MPHFSLTTTVMMLLSILIAAFAAVDAYDPAAYASSPPVYPTRKSNPCPSAIAKFS